MIEPPSPTLMRAMAALGAGDDDALCRALAAQDRWREFLTHADAFEASDLVPDRDTLARRPLLRSRPS